MIFFCLAVTARYILHWLMCFDHFDYIDNFQSRFNLNNQRFTF